MCPSSLEMEVFPEFDPEVASITTGGDFRCPKGEDRLRVLNGGGEVLGVGALAADMVGMLAAVIAAVVAVIAI